MLNQPLPMWKYLNANYKKLMISEILKKKKTTEYLTQMSNIVQEKMELQEHMQVLENELKKLKYDNLHLQQIR